MTTNKERTLDDVILWPDDDEKITQFKCTQCNCIQPMFPDHSNHTHVLEKGYGLKRNWNACIRLNCGCHTGIHPLPRILSRSVSLDEALGVKDG